MDAPTQTSKVTGNPSTTDTYDAIVIGGGPAGSTSALRMARKGLRVLILERAVHPRFHIGESFLPRNLALIKELGLAEKLAALPQVPKYGAEFAYGHEQSSMHFRFDSGFPVGETYAFNIERAPFDNMLLSAAKEAGVDVIEGPAAAVRAVPVLTDGNVVVETADATYRARILLDASGQGTVIGRKLGTRKVHPNHKKSAYFGHLTGVVRMPQPVGGYPIIVMCDEGWFWMIPIDDERTSIGAVLDAEVAKKIIASGVPATQLLSWAIPRVPFIAARTQNAVFPTSNEICADFSYRCDPFAGPGYFLVGDAATFLDPIFSTGVCLAMMGGVQAADRAHKILKENASPEPLRRSYISYVNKSSSAFFRMVQLYYHASFRELFMTGKGPAEVERAVIALLAGNVFPPHPPFKLWWRVKFFEFMVYWQKRIPMTPRRTTFSLLNAGPLGPAAQGREPKPVPRQQPVGVGAP